MSKIQTTGVVKYAAGAAKDFGHGPRINVVFSTTTHGEVKIWGSPESDLANLKKADTVSLLHDEAKNTWEVLVPAAPAAAPQPAKKATAPVPASGGDDWFPAEPPPIPSPNAPELPQERPASPPPSNPPAAPRTANEAQRARVGGRMWNPPSDNRLSEMSQYAAAQAGLWMMCYRNTVEACNKAGLENEVPPETLERVTTTVYLGLARRFKQQ